MRIVLPLNPGRRFAWLLNGEGAALWWSSCRPPRPWSTGSPSAVELGPWHFSLVNPPAGGRRKRSTGLVNGNAIGTMNNVHLIRCGLLTFDKVTTVWSQDGGFSGLNLELWTSDTPKGRPDLHHVRNFRRPLIGAFQLNCYQPASFGRLALFERLLRLLTNSVKPEPLCCVAWLLAD